MKVYTLMFQMDYWDEQFTRSVHLTEKGALIEQCNYLLELLLDIDWKEEDEKEMVYLSKIIEKDDNITIAQLLEYSKLLQFYANNAEIYTQIEPYTLLP